MRTVKEYYRTKESKLGYNFLLKGVRHFGYYPTGVRTNHFQAQRNMMKLLAKELKLKAKTKVLDAGCEEGTTALFIADKFGYKMTGIDLLEESIDTARSKASSRMIEADFQIADFRKLPFKDRTFDGVYALESLIHANDPKAVIGEFGRVLKPGGRLVIADYTTVSVEELPKPFRNVVRQAVDGASAPGLEIIHHEFYEKNLPRLGFNDISVKDITANIMPMLAWFKRLAFIPYHIFKLVGLHRRYTNTSMGYFGKKIASEG
jgi:ubiquinone/menaquinone biosynthesis C-methylase UbiE